jgi:type 1 glutamine amidotransferase
VAGGAGGSVNGAAGANNGGAAGSAGASGSGALAGGAGSGGVAGAAGTSQALGGLGGGAGELGSAGNASAGSAGAGGAGPFKVFMIASTAPEHTPMSNAAVPVVQGLGALNGFTVDATSDTSLMTDENLSHYQVFLQMQLGSFEMPPSAQAALQKYIEQGKGWVGVHAAGLTGIQFIEDKDGNIIGDLKYWPWYTTFIGGDEGFVWSIHPAEQQGTLIVEDRTHPVTKNLPASFQLKDEWYEWKENPRPHVHVLCTADESSYTPVNRQGDHPIVWSNPAYPHTVYIGVGHDVASLQNPNYVTLLRDSILWAAGH